MNRIPINFIDEKNNGQHGMERDDDDAFEIIIDSLPDGTAGAETGIDALERELSEESSPDLSEAFLDPANNNSSISHDANAVSAKTEKELRGAYEKLRAELFATRAELRRVETELEKSSVETKTGSEQLTRLHADFENHRKRIERERGETYNRIVGDVVEHLFPVMDNLRRALEVEASLEASESEEFRHFLHGVELIAKQLGGVVESLGIETVATVGQHFDPHVHEAIETEPSDEFEPDTVIQELVRGYRLGNKLLRPAKVKVATKL